MAQMLLASSTGSKDLDTGDHIEVDVDLVYLHEALGRCIDAFTDLEELGARVWDTERVVVVLDHWVPAPNEASASNHRRIRDFVKRAGLRRFYDVGRGGISHQLIAEEGLVLPGNIVLGSDSHTPTLGALGALAMGSGPTDLVATLIEGRTWIKVPGSIEVRVDGTLGERVSAMDLALWSTRELGTDGGDGNVLEYHGRVISELDMAGRFTLANMSAEVGALSCLVPGDRTTVDFLRRRASERFFLQAAAPEGPYSASLVLEGQDLEPMVAGPPDPAHVTPVREVEALPVDQVYIGSCANGRTEDLRRAAAVLKGRRVAQDTRLIVSPASQRTYLEALRDGTIGVLVRAGAVVTTPGCNACFGGHQGLLAPEEICVSTTNRNFPGRMGARDADIFLASPTTAAACALKGEITDPREV